MATALTALATTTLASSSATVTDCIYFQGHIQNTGYGVKRRNGKIYKAHRLAFIDAYGEIPDGLIIDHICHTEAIRTESCEGGWDCKHRACINPAHLQAITRAENNREGLNGLDNRVHCKNGHNIAEVGIYEWNGVRSCHECRLINARKAQARYKSKKKLEALIA